MRAPIHAIKHYHQITLSTVTTGTRNLENLVIATVPSDVSALNEVVEGAIVKAVWFELWAIGSVSSQFFTAIVVKEGIGQLGPSFTELTALGSYNNKKNILYTTQGLASNDGIAMPLPLYKGWIKIPKSKQRFGLGDRLVFAIASRGSATIEYCGFATYKEYT